MRLYRKARRGHSAMSIAAGLVVFTAWAARSQDAPSTQASLNPLRALQKTKFKDFLELPLFDPSRHLAPPPLVLPRVVEMPRVAVPEAPPPSLHLLGIIQGKRDIAVVRRNADGKTIMLSSGDKVDTWAVTVLPTLGIQLREGDRVVDYALFGPVTAPRGGVSTDDAPNP